jgi:hypothetical protein
VTSIVKLGFESGKGPVRAPIAVGDDRHGLIQAHNAAGTRHGLGRATVYGQ